MNPQRERGLNDEAIRLLQVNNSQGNRAEHTSLLHLYRAHNLFRFARGVPGASELQQIAGGNHRFPKMLAESLNNEVLFRHEVTEIESGADGVTVRCANGNRYLAAHAVVVVPFPPLRRIALRPGLPNSKPEPWPNWITCALPKCIWW